MMLPTKEDIEFLIHILTSVDPQYPVVKGEAVGARLKNLLPLYDKGLGGLPVGEVDIHWSNGEIETYNVGDENWPYDETVKELRAHVNKHECMGNRQEDTETTV